jgi:hypothetical protein
LTIDQTAEYCGVDRAEVYYKMLRDLEARRIGVRDGSLPFGRPIRIERGSMMRLIGSPDAPVEVPLFFRACPVLSVSLG